MKSFKEFLTEDNGNTLVIVVDKKILTDAIRDIGLNQWHKELDEIKAILKKNNFDNFDIKQNSEEGVFIFNKKSSLDMVQAKKLQKDILLKIKLIFGNMKVYFEEPKV